MSHKVAVINGKKPLAGVGGVSDSDLSNIAVNFLTNGVAKLDDYKVVPQSTPDMTVKIVALTSVPSVAYVEKADGSNKYVSALDTTTNLTITPNSSGNPRIDAIIIKLDLAVTPDNFGGNVATLVVMPGTPAGSPVAPTDNEIQTYVGAGNPFLRLANISVINGAASIDTAQITDTRVWVRNKLAPNPNAKAVTYASNITIDLADSNDVNITLTGNPTLAVKNFAVGQYLSLKLIQDGTGNRTVSWWSGIKWPDGVAPTPSTSAGKIDRLIIQCTAVGVYEGYIAGQNL